VLIKSKQEGKMKTKTEKELEKEIEKIWKVKAKDVNKEVTGDRDRWMTDLTEVRELVLVVLEKAKEEFNKKVEKLIRDSELDYQITKEIPYNYGYKLPYHLKLLIKRWKEFKDKIFKEEKSK